MSLVNAINDDDDNRSLISSPDSDVDYCQSYGHTHRSCSRHARCNKKNHQHPSIDSTTTSKSLANSSKPIKNSMRSVDNEPRHKQKYDGTKWRRICCVPDCLRYLNGGVYYENWLCRKHYLLTLTIDISSDSDSSTTDDTNTIISTRQGSRKPSTRQSHRKIETHKRFDMRVQDDGTRQKYDGKSWRPVCNYDKCISFAVAHGYCYRHDMEMRKKPSEVLSSSDDTPQEPISKSKITRTSVLAKPKKGDIQLIRQQWNGTKWYSLCHHYTRDCQRRSAGIKCAYLCDIHFKEFQEKKRNNDIPLSPTTKRQKLINDDNILSVDILDKQRLNTSYRSKSPVHQIKQTEQCIQTDLTCPLDSSDLQQGCFLIEDDDYDQYQSESSQLMLCIKKEDEGYLANARKMSIKNSMGNNALSINCKIELTKIEF